MKHNTLVIGLIVLSTVLFQNCGKDDKPSTPTLISIEDYISQNNLSPVYTSSGLGHIISNEGDAQRAGNSSTIKTIVSVKTTDGQERINTQGELILNLFIQVPGLIEGIQLLGEGGSARLFVPYELAWGAQGISSIPAEADVIMDISLVEILPDIETYIEENGFMISDITANGTYVLIEEAGDGTFPTANSSVTVKYSGYHTNGDVFDSSTTGLTIGLGQVIRGWTEGIPQFSKGGKGKLFIPYESAYGEDGSSSIPGRTDIIFDIELVDFQ